MDVVFVVGLYGGLFDGSSGFDRAYYRRAALVCLEECSRRWGLSDVEFYRLSYVVLNWV